jgi:hypothetical protein
MRSTLEQAAELVGSTVNKIELLSRAHDREHFDCGSAPLFDRFAHLLGVQGCPAVELEVSKSELIRQSRGSSQKRTLRPEDIIRPKRTVQVNPGFQGAPILRFESNGLMLFIREHLKELAL